MKTKELIKQLQEQDPSGELDVCAGNDPILFVEKLPAYYDGPKHMLIQDASRTGYNITGFKITGKGEKVKLHVYDLECYLADNYSGLVDVSELSSEHKARYRKKIAEFKSEMNKIDEISSLSKKD